MRERERSPYRVVKLTFSIPFHIFAPFKQNAPKKAGWHVLKTSKALDPLWALQQADVSCIRKKMGEAGKVFHLILSKGVFEMEFSVNAVKIRAHFSALNQRIHDAPGTQQP